MTDDETLIQTCPVAQGNAPRGSGCGLVSLARSVKLVVSRSLRGISLGCLTFAGCRIFSVVFYAWAKGLISATTESA